MSSRPCLSAVPVPHTGEGYDFGGPRIGPMSRQGSNSSLHSGAAGAFSPRSGFEARAAMTVDSIPKRRAEPSFSSSDAAGSGSPRLEVRALHVDDALRRAHSAPPTNSQTAFEVAVGAQAFGVVAGSGRVRQIQEPSPSMTRAEVGCFGMAFGDIDSVLGRRRHAGAPPPVHSASSARLAASSVAGIDIDAHSGRRRGPAQQRSDSWDLPAGDSTPAERRKFFDHGFLADRHAAFMGRPGGSHASGARHPQRSRDSSRESSRQPCASRARTCSAQRSAPQQAMDALIVEAASAAGIAVRSQSRRFAEALSVKVSAAASNAGRAPPQVLEPDVLADVQAPGSSCDTPTGSCCAVISPAGGTFSGAATTASGAVSGVCSFDPSPIASPTMSDAGDDIVPATDLEAAPPVKVPPALQQVMSEAAPPVKVPLALQRVMSSMSSGTESTSLAAKAAAVLDMKSRALPVGGRAHRVGKPAVAQKARRWQ